MKVKGTRKYIFLSLCLFVGGFLYTQHESHDEVERDIPLVTVSKGNLEININTIGALDAARSHMVASTIRGDKGKLVYLIPDGTRVENGDVLVRLDPTFFEEEVHRLKGEVLSLKAALEAQQQILEWEKNQIEKEIRTAEFNLKVADLELKKLAEGDGPLNLAQFKEEMEKAKQEHARYRSYIRELKNLSKKGITNPTEISLASKKASELQEKYHASKQKYLSYKKHVLPALIGAAEAKVEQSEMELTQTRNGSVFKIAKTVSSLREVEGKLKTTRASLNQAQNELKKTTIRAPFSGLAILYAAYRDGQKRKPRIGDRVWQNQPLLYLPDISSMIVKTRIREIDLHKIELNQKCTVSVDAYPDVHFNGEVIFIGALASERREISRGEKYFDLTVALRDHDNRLRPGMTARVLIQSDHVKDALCVPLQAVFQEGERKYCYQLLKNGFKKVQVSTGRMNENMVEILSGLRMSDKVSIVEPPEDLITQISHII